MVAKLNKFALVGIDGVPVEAEVDASPGMPKTVLVGPPSATFLLNGHVVWDLRPSDGFHLVCTLKRKYL